MSKFLLRILSSGLTNETGLWNGNIVCLTVQCFPLFLQAGTNNLCAESVENFEIYKDRNIKFKDAR